MTPEELDAFQARAKQAKVTPKEMQEKRPDLVRKPNTLDLRLPYPPSNNRYYRHSKGRTYLSAEGVEYRLRTLALCRECDPMEGRLSVTITMFPRVGLGQDLDNIPKAVLDSLQNAKVFENDSQIDDLRIVRGLKVKEPYLDVRISKLIL